MIVKTHGARGRIILAACDSDLLGRTVEEGNKILDLKSEFYRGMEMGEDDFLELALRAYIINAVGKEVVKLLVEKKIVEDKETAKISGIPYVNVLFENQ